MTWDRLALCLNYVLGALLVFRLLRLRLHTVYAVFCFYIVVQLLAESLVFLNAAHQIVDYRVLFIAGTALAWIPALWMVYALLGAMLATIPGVLRFSRKLLNATFVVAALVAIATAWPQMQRAEGLGASLDSGVAATFATDRVVATAALFTLLVIIAFVLWFPVQMPRNLVLFSFGYVALFSFNVVVIFAHALLQTHLKTLLSVIYTSVQTACFVYWLATLSREGEAIPLRIGHAWQASQQQQLLQQLESMNAALARNAR